MKKTFSLTFCMLICLLLMSTTYKTNKYHTAIAVYVKLTSGTCYAAVISNSLTIWQDNSSWINQAMINSSGGHMLEIFANAYCDAYPEYVNRVKFD